MVPDVDLVKFRTEIISFKDRLKGKVNELEMDPKLKEAGWEKYADFKMWFEKRLDDAIKKAEEDEQLLNERTKTEPSIFYKIGTEMKNARDSLPEGPKLPEI